MVDVARSLATALVGPLLLLPLPAGVPWPRSGPGSADGRGMPPAEVAAASRGPAVPEVGSPGTGWWTADRSGSPAPLAVHARTDRPRWRWPLVPRPTVLRPFSAPPGPYGPGHRGVDLGAAAGSPVLAVEAGVVTHAGRVAGRGTLTVTHAGGLASTYEPVHARVVAGIPVAAGDVLGVLEAPAEVPAGGHCLLLACLHLGARRDDVYLDPLLLLRGGRVRLLPSPPAQPTTG